MTPAEKVRRATLLCQRLAADVAGIVPEGIGHWETAWDIVADADAAFLAALTAWEATGAELERARVRDAYNAVLEAWKVAAREYRREVAV